MLKSLLLSAMVGLAAVGTCLGQSTTQPVAPSAATAADDLKNSPRHGEWDDIPIPGSTVKLHTWVVYPERPDKAPVVLVIHEIFGMSDWVRATADQLAAQGFIAVAPDLLSGKGPNGGGTESFTDPTEGVSRLTSDEVVVRLNAARDYALAFPSATDKSASIGFCWGGGASFNYAANQPKLNAAVVFYGVPPSKDAMAKITCPILGNYAGNDARISATVPATTAAMAALQKSYDPHIFDGAGHGFLRQQSGQNGANLKAAQQAWPATIAFLKKYLETAKAN
ncbi:MAG: dienelactone hydrolase family protein [Tepidisphaeraceae bacterium]|jgi:carboxymethylenebutenolidase